MGKENSNGIDKQYFGDEKLIAWKKQRWGCFSGSESACLFVPGKIEKGAAAPNLFSDGAWTLIRKIAVQKYTVFHDDDKVETLAMRKGKINEPIAAAHLNRITGYDMDYHGGEDPIFVRYDENSGASPDMTKRDENDLIIFGAELKCREDKQHADFLDFLVEKGSGLKSIHLAQFSPEDYAQIQFNILSAGEQCEFWFYQLFNDFFPTKTKSLLMKVDKDEAWQKKAKLKLKQAVIERDKIIEKWNSW